MTAQRRRFDRIGRAGFECQEKSAGSCCSGDDVLSKTLLAQATASFEDEGGRRASEASRNESMQRDKETSERAVPKREQEMMVGVEERGLMRIVTESRVN